MSGAGPLTIVALGGNALLRRGEESSAANQHAAAKEAAWAWAWAWDSIANAFFAALDAEAASNA